MSSQAAMETPFILLFFILMEPEVCCGPSVAKC